MVRMRRLSLATAVSCTLFMAGWAGAADPEAASLTGAAPDSGAAATPGGRRVLYLPDTVKEQLREQIRQDVLDEFRKERWAVPDAVPEWTKRLRFYGDVRIRYEADIFPAGNANSGEFPDFNGINTSTPFDLKGVDLSGDKYLNVDTNRSRFRLRARLGLDADLGGDTTVGILLASGDQNSPVSPNQTLGASGGYFSMYQIWIDRAFLRFNPVHDAGGELMFEAGRFENPFFTAKDLLWSENVNLDGFAFQGGFAAGDLWPSFTLGASPVYSTAFAFPAYQTAKYNSVNKWLFAGQIAADWKLAERLQLKLGGALYYFYRVSGVAATCDTNLTNISCSGDDTRPSFAQKGNTYMALRVPSAAAMAAESANPLATPRYQYFGLASQFREVFATGRLNYRFLPETVVTLEGEFAWNEGYSRTQIAAVAVNNCVQYTPACQSFLGGQYAYVGRISFGTPQEVRQGDWNVNLAYLHVESDSVIDAFTNPDFGYGGTNLQGYWLGARVLVANNVTVGVRWMSADQIAGPTYRFDLLQVDMWGRF